MWYSGCVVIFPYISPNSPKSFGNIFPPATYWGNPATSWGMSSTPPDWENPAAVGKNKPNRMGHFMIFSIPSLQRVHIPPRRNAVKSSTQTCLDLVWDVLVGSLWSVFFCLPSHQKCWMIVSNNGTTIPYPWPPKNWALPTAALWFAIGFLSDELLCLHRGPGALEALHISHQNEKKRVITIFLKVGTLLVPISFSRNIQIRYRNFHLFCKSYFFKPWGVDSWSKAGCPYTGMCPLRVHHHPLLARLVLSEWI